MEGSQIFFSEYFASTIIADQLKMDNNDNNNDDNEQRKFLFCSTLPYL